MNDPLIPKTMKSSDGMMRAEDGTDGTDKDRDIDCILDGVEKCWVSRGGRNEREKLRRDARTDAALTVSIDRKETCIRLGGKDGVIIPISHVVNVLIRKIRGHDTVKIITHPPPSSPGCCCGGDGKRHLRGLKTYALQRCTADGEETVDKSQRKNADVKKVSSSESRWGSAFVRRVKRIIRGNDALSRSVEDLPVLVLINPVSGSGQAKRRYETEVAPYFEAVEFPTEVAITQRSGHGKDIARKLDYKKYRGIVVASGDGLLYEVLQGIMARDDALNAIQEIELGILPLGSGNGLAASILKDAGERDVTDLLSAAFWIARGGVRNIDIASIECGGSDDGASSPSSAAVFFSFLCVEWALFADIDIESEWLRCCGAARFTIWGVWRIMCCLRTYRGTFSYLPVNAAVEDRDSGADDDDDENDSVSATKSSDSKSENDDVVVLTSSRLIDRNVVPTLDKPVPKTWKTIQGDIVQFWAANTTMQSGDPLEMAPSAEFDDGVMHITINRSLSCCKMSQLALFSFPEGKHEDDPSCLIIRTRAFRLVPESPAPPGILAADGEVLPYGPIQVLVHRGLARIMARPKPKRKDN